MKKTLLFLCAAVLAMAACSKDLEPSGDVILDGEKVDVSPFAGVAGKLFVLNEGGLGSNNSTLDFLRFPDGKYVRGAFRQMNPDVAAGLGDVGNDIAVNGDEVWIVVNNSGIVEVISAIDESEIAAIPVPTPRSIAFDSKYAYVTSWAGAYVNYGSDYSVSDYKNPKGQVYRIDLKTKKISGSVEVGYQPEGIACYGGKLYVANSGGVSSQLPPAYSYDNTLSIIDAGSFTLSSTVNVAVNLKSVLSAGNGFIYVSSYGNFYDVHSALYVLHADNPSTVTMIGVGHIKPEALHVSACCIRGNTVYCVGTENEFDWNALHAYYVWSVNDTEVKFYPVELSGTPYGLYVLESKGGNEYMILGDAGDYYNPGTVSCYNISDSSKLWSVTAGVCPGHFALW